MRHRFGSYAIVYRSYPFEGNKETKIVRTCESWLSPFMRRFIPSKLEGPCSIFSVSSNSDFEYRTWNYEY